MALEEADIARMDALLEALGAKADPALLESGLESRLESGLARLLPGISRRRCDAGDVLEEPFRRVGGIDIHLLDASGHCIRVTDNPAEATALLIATAEELRA